MPAIHPTAIVDPQVEVADEVTIGAYCIITGPVTIGAGTVIHAHTLVAGVAGTTRIGRACQIGPAAYIGLPPQHLRANLEIGQLIIGDRVIIRETATIHRSTAAGEDHATRIGDDCFLMGGAHIGHDCVLADHVTCANAVLLGGHCQIGARAFLGGGAAFHQFVRVGRLAIISGVEPVTQDVPPFAAFRYRALKGYNAVGCRRSGMSRQAIHALRSAFRILHANRVTSQAVAQMTELASSSPEVAELIAFIKSSRRGIVPSLRSRGQLIDESTSGDDTGGED
jgi:UDP-N-acetylglucosamine acyltransferase